MDFSFRFGTDHRQLGLYNCIAVLKLELGVRQGYISKMGDIVEVPNEGITQFGEFRRRMLDMKRNTINADFQEFCLQSKQSTFCRDIFNTLDELPHNTGACIFTRPAGIERSCIAKLVAKEKFEEGLFSGVIYFAFPKNFTGNPQEALLKSIGCYKNTYSRFSQCVPSNLEKNVLLILDCLENAKNCPSIGKFIAGLAVSAVNATHSKWYTTLALCDDKAFAKEIAKEDYRIKVKYREGDRLQTYFTYGSSRSC